ncbi:hypothetical protein NKG05_12455 [Oerskovia sp. M15]
MGIAVVPILGGRQLVGLWRVRRSEFAVAVACYLGVLLLGPIRGVLVAFLLSVIDVVRRAADPSVDTSAVPRTRPLCGDDEHS